MGRRVLVLDTSILCCWLSIPGKETAGPADDQWDQRRVSELLDREGREGSTFVLPIATLIETGNHIAQAPHSRYEKACELVGHLRLAAESTNPWTAFTEQSELWGVDNLNRLACEWPNLAARRVAMGDATIKFIADHYSVAGYSVEIVTADAALKAYEPRKSSAVPRRRS